MTQLCVAWTDLCLVVIVIYDVKARQYPLHNLVDSLSATDQRYWFRDCLQNIGLKVFGLLSCWMFLMSAAEWLDVASSYLPSLYIRDQELKLLTSHELTSPLLDVVHLFSKCYR